MATSMIRQFSVRVRKSNCRVWSLWGAVLIGVASGCGTTRVSDTTRTGSEQLLVSNSIDKAVSELDLAPLAGKPVFLDAQFMEGVVDKGYVVSTLRQHLLDNGALLMEDRNRAAYVVECRAGAVGTDRYELLYGFPSATVPTLVPGQPGGTTPEIPFAKKTTRNGVAKLAVFAYNRNTGQPLLQSGVVMKTCTAKDCFVLGTGPYTQGTLYSAAQDGHDKLRMPSEDHEPKTPAVAVTQAAVWPATPTTPAESVAGKPETAPPPRPVEGVNTSGQGPVQVVPAIQEKPPPRPEGVNISSQEAVPAVQEKPPPRPVERGNTSSQGPAQDEPAVQEKPQP
jgi:hypothetical protein